LGKTFTLLVPLGSLAVRIEARDAQVRVTDGLALISGEVVAMRPTAEPPWALEMRFRPEPADDPSIPGYLEYWRSVRAWLDGSAPDPPRVPSV